MRSLSNYWSAVLLLVIMALLSLALRFNDENEKVFIPGEATWLPCDVDERLDYLSHTWRKDDKEVKLDQRISLDSRSGTLVIKSPDETDEGLYRCLATSLYGISVSVEIKLLQAFHDNFKRSGSSETHIPEVGSPFIISCRPPLSRPPSRVYWAIESDRLPEEFVDGRRIDTDFQGNLYFSNVEQQDARRLVRYFCMSQNELLGTHFADDGRQPTLMWSSTVNDTGIVGSRKVLKCIFGGMPTPEVTWSHPSKHPSTRPSKKDAHVGNEYVIDHVTTDDEGTHECRARNEAGVASAFINLQVHAKPRWGEFGRPPALIELDVDSRVTIRCDAHALPPPTPRWFVNGTPTHQRSSERMRVEDGGGLLIQSATVEDTSVLQCLLSNDHGSLLANVAVVVREAPPYFEEQPKDRRALVGSDVELKCRAKGAPRPEVTWYRGRSRSRVIGGAKFSIHPSGNLKMAKVDKTDEGIYACVASNKLNKIESSASLIVRDPPRVAGEKVLIVASEGEDITLPCGVWFEPDDEMQAIWTFGHERVEPNERRALHGRDLLIDAVGLGDAGAYTCFVEWAGEEIARSKEVKVVLAEVPGAPSNLSVDCTSDPFVVRMSWIVGSSNFKDISSCQIHMTTMTTATTIPPSGRGNSSHGRTSVLERKRPYRPFEVVRENLRVQPWTEYSFRVACSNQQGSSPLSQPIACKTPATLPSKDPSNVCVEMSGTNQLLVVWEPLTEDEVNGENFHYVVLYRPMHHSGPFEKVLARGFNQSRVVIPNQEPFNLFLISVQSANEEGHRRDHEYAFGYSSEKVPELTPTRFRVEWSNGSQIKFSWTSHGEQELGAFIRGFQIKIWKRYKPDEVVLKGIDSGRKSRKCGKHIDPNRVQLSNGFEMDAVIDLNWSDVEVFSAIRYVTDSHKGPYSDQIPFKISEDSVLSYGLKLEQLGTNHAFLRWSCFPGDRRGKYSHRISLSAADKSLPLQLTYVEWNSPCSHLIKVLHLKPSKRYQVNVTRLLEKGTKDDKSSDSIEIKTRPFYVPDEPIIENIEFVDMSKIKVVLFPTNNAPSHYCVQFKEEVVYSQSTEWSEDVQCRTWQQQQQQQKKKNCSSSGSGSGSSSSGTGPDSHSSHFEFHDFDENRLWKLTVDLPAEASYVRVISSHLLNNCSLALVASAPFKLLSAPNRESMLQRELNNSRSKTIVWLIAVSVMFVLLLVIFVAVFLCINSWRSGQVYSVRSSEMDESKKIKTLDTLDHRGCRPHQKSPKIRPTEVKLFDDLKSPEDFWGSSGGLMVDNIGAYNDYRHIGGETICKTPSVANTLV